MKMATLLSETDLNEFKNQLLCSSIVNFLDVTLHARKSGRFSLPLLHAKDHDKPNSDTSIESRNFL